MPTNIGSFLSSYDFFGKTIPGVVWLIGLVSLIPSDSPILSSPENITVGNIVIVIIAGIAVGLIFGEGVHNLAINIESIFGWLRSRLLAAINIVVRIIKGMARFFREVIQPRSPPRGNDPSEPNDHEIMEENGNSLGDTILDATGDPGQRAFDYLSRGFDDWNEDFDILYPSEILRRFRGFISYLLREIEVGLTPHRELFLQRLEAQLNPMVEPTDKTSYTYQKFSDAFGNQFGVALDQPEGGDVFQETYILTVSRLEANDYQTARGFQSRFSFARSMWVTLGGFASVYAVVFIYHFKTSLQKALLAVPDAVGSAILAEPAAFGILTAIATAIILGYLIERSIIFIKDSDRNSLSWQKNPVSIFIVGAWYPIHAWLIFWLFRNTALTPGFLLRPTVNLIVSMILAALNFTINVFAFLLALLGVSTFDATNLVLFEALNGIVGPFILILAISTILFFDACGDYKEFYVEYLITEFSEAVTDEKTEKPILMNEYFL